MAATVGTLYEFDMILSVSQEAINKQFEVLYNTPDPTKSKQRNRPKLIPEDMKLGYKAYDDEAKKWVDTPFGVSAKIECPTVDLNDNGDDDSKHRSLRLKIKMKGKTSTGSSQSKLTFINQATGLQNVKEIDGWTVSWLAKIGSREIQKIEEAAMHPDAKNQIESSLKEVPHEDYLVSSLFCLFESTQIATSFKLTDSEDKPIESTSQIGAFLNNLQVTCKAMANDPTQRPYVLGYGISQKISRPITGTPKFLPSKFIFSVTPCSQNKGQASLNFCMINANDHSLSDPQFNTLTPAGVFTSPFVCQTRATNLKADGVFAVSNALYFRQWLQNAILVFDIGTQLAKDMGCTAEKPIITGGAGLRAASSKTSWAGGWVKSSGYDEYQYSGNTSVTVKYDSVLQAQPTGDIAVDKKREMTIEANGEIYAKKELRSKSPPYPAVINGYAAPIPPPERWPVDNQGYHDVKTLWDFRLKIEAAEDGKWSVKREVWNPPKVGEPQWHPNKDFRPDIIFLARLIFGDSFDTTLKTDLEKLAVKEFQKAAEALTSISNAVIMPAGGVYTFLGLDCDDSGNLYSHIKYKTKLK